MTGAMQPKANILRFQPNIPQEVVLKFPSGMISKTKHPERNYPDQMMFTLTSPDNSRMYLPVPFGEYLVNTLRAQPGERLLIGSYETRNGVKRSVEWRASRIDPNPPPQTPAPASPAPPQQDLVPVLQQSIDQAKAARQPQSPSGPAAAAPPASVNGQSQNHHTPANRNDPNGAVSVQIAASAKPVPLKLPYDVAMTHFFIVCGRSAREAERVLGAEGAPVKFDSRDIAAAATTLLIHALNKQMIALSDHWPGRAPQGGAQ